MRVFRKKSRTPKLFNKASRIEKRLLKFIGKVHKDLSFLENIEFLGEGTYAFVKLVYDKSRSKQVALKIIEKSTLVVERRFTNCMVG